MSDNGWPDKPGVPLHSERDGWHWMVMVPGARPVPQHWTAGPFSGGWAALSTPGAGQRYQYAGPCLTPAEVAAREAAAFQRGLESAARDVDCVCDIRDAVLARLESQGHRRASYLCSHGDVCCALQAAAIRALPVPEDKP